MVGLDAVLDSWAAQQALSSQGFAFSPLAALHPGYLDSPFAQRLEAQGHDARTALGSYAGELQSGFELALRGGDSRALVWWLVRGPELVNGSLPSRGAQLPWLPLARVRTPNYMPDPALRRSTVEYLLARGADPWRRLPQDPRESVVSCARELKSPLLSLLDPPYAGTPAGASAAASSSYESQMPQQTR